MARKCPHCGANHGGEALRCTATGLPIGGDPGLVGSTIAKRYHLVRLLGDGGMGAVYKAADQVLRRFVAIKLLHPATAQNPSAVERFVREARSAASIGHPNIIDILDFGHEGQRPFLVMEYLRGRSLSQAIANESPFSMRRACSIATHTLAGLAAAHEKGILHRDLKPANLMLIAQLGDRDFVKICDFGFAALLIPKRRIDDDKNLTPARTLVGTPAYAAPERLRGDDRRDPRIDVYSVGVVLFEMLAGVRPFDAPTFAELARMVRHDDPPSLRSIRSDIPAGLDRVVQKSLAKDRSDRWGSCEEMAAALVPFGGRSVAIVDDHPSDSFTMDLLRIKARETQRQKALASSQAAEVLSSHDKAREKKRRRRRPEPFPEPGTGTQSVEAIEEVSMDPLVSTDSGVGEQTSTMRRMERAEEMRGGREWPTNDTAPHQAPAPHAFPPTKHPPAPPLSAPPVPPAHQRVVPAPVTEPSAFQPPPIHPPPPLIPSQPAPAVVAPQGLAFSGTFVLSILRFVSRRFGERSLKDVLEALEPGIRAIFQVGIAETQWVSSEAVHALVHGIDAKLGHDDLHLAVLCGRAAAEGSFERMRQVRPPSPPPELLLAELPSILQELVQGVSYHVRRVGRGYGRFEIEETGEPSLVSCVQTLGFIDRSLDRFGAADVEVNLLSCRALGDPGCLLEISWLT